MSPKYKCGDTVWILRGVGSIICGTVIHIKTDILNHEVPFYLYDINEKDSVNVYTGLFENHIYDNPTGPYQAVKAQMESDAKKIRVELNEIVHDIKNLDKWYENTMKELEENKNGNN